MKRRCGFTLIELLVVIGVVSLLLGMMLPSLQAARDQARSARCGSSLKQMGIALHMYSTENRGRALPAAHSGEMAPTYWWGQEDQGEIDFTRGAMWPYLKSETKQGGLYECPSQPWGSYEPQGVGGAVTSTYGYNGYFLSPPATPGWSWAIGHRPWVTLDHLDRSSEVFAFADTLLRWGPQTQNTVLLDPPWIFQAGGWHENLFPTTAFRHRGKALVTHVDGHVAPHGPGRGKVSDGEPLIGSVGDENGPHYIPDWRDW